MSNPFTNAFPYHHNRSFVWCGSKADFHPLSTHSIKPYILPATHIQWNFPKFPTSTYHFIFGHIWYGLHAHAKSVTFTTTPLFSSGKYRLAFRFSDAYRKCMQCAKYSTSELFVKTVPTIEYKFSVRVFEFSSNIDYLNRKSFSKSVKMPDIKTIFVQNGCVLFECKINKCMKLNILWFWICFAVEKRWWK